MLQRIRCSALCQAAMPLRPRSGRKPLSGGRPLRGPSSSSSTATASSRGDGRLFPPGRRGLLPTLAGLSSVAIACVAATESFRPAGSVLAAASTPNSALSAVVGEEEEEQENAELVAAAHELRRSLTPPHQSLFRVVCILVYEDSAGNLHRITGTNAEASTIGGSICAERAAMCKLREASDCKRVTKVVVVTDNPGPLAPGVLCREFLSTHLAPSTPVVMAGAGGGCDVLGGLLYGEELGQKSSPEIAVPARTTANVGSADGGGGSTGASSNNNNNNNNNSSSSSCSGSIDGGSSNSTNNAGVAGVADGTQAAASRAPARLEPASSTCDCRTAAGRAGGDRAPSPTTTTTTMPGMLRQPSPGVAPGGVTTVLTADSSKGGSELQGGVAGRKPQRGDVDVCTVGDLYPWRNIYGVTGRRELLRLGFLRQQVAEELAKPGLAETLGLDRGVLAAHDAAWRATAEDKRDGVHPIRYAAVALFSDGEAEIAHQLKALEYGATLDPVALLAPAMIRRAKDGIRPSWIIVCDQFGLMHAPFAQARTFLSEHGFGETKVALHAEDGAVVVVKAKDLVPSVATSR